MCYFNREAMQLINRFRRVVRGPWGDTSRHLPLDALADAVLTLEPPKDQGSVALIVSRSEGSRTTPANTILTVDGGMPGDAWFRDNPDQIDAQITMMRVDVAQLIANGQPLSLFGDNLLVDLDLSVSNLPPGSRLSVGAALVEVTPKPHNGCVKFRQRFGRDALRLTADPRFRQLRLRGIHVKVVEEGRVAVGDSLRLVMRAGAG
jgi:hypothetical protein